MQRSAQEPSQHTRWHAALPEGAPLEEGATYIDLSDPQRREFTATGKMHADRAHWYVPKDNIQSVCTRHKVRRHGRTPQRGSRNQEVSWTSEGFSSRTS